MATITIDGHIYEVLLKTYSQILTDTAMAISNKVYYKNIIIPQHIETLASVYPFDIRDIKRLWSENNYCSMIRLENVLREVQRYESNDRS